MEKGKEEEELLPITNQDASKIDAENKLRQRKVHNNEKGEIKSDKKKSGVLNKFQTYLTNSPIFKKSVLKWNNLQKKYPYFEGSEESGYPMSVPVVLHKYIEFESRYRKAIRMTFVFGFIILMMFWFLNSEIEQTIKIHSNENKGKFFIDQNGNPVENIFDLKKSSEIYIPTKNKLFDEWFSNNGSKAMKEFSDEEFKSGFFEDSIFFSKASGFLIRNQIPFNFSIEDLEKTLNQICFDKNNCDCFYLFQIGISRNAIFLFNEKENKTQILYDPKILQTSPKNMTISIHFHEKQEQYHNDKEVENEKKVKFQVPISSLVRFKTKETRGNFKTQQFFESSSACIFNGMLMNSNYQKFIENFGITIN